MMKAKFFVFLLLTFLSFKNSYSQTRYGFNQYQLIFYAGSSHFFGDLGGSDSKGSNSPIDLNLGTTGYSVGLGLSRKLNNSFSLRLNLNEATVRGSDSYTNDKFRNNRNLSFRSTIHELSTMVDYTVFTLNKSGKHPHCLIAFAGVGVFNFNPQAQYNNKWYDLQPLGTEGQGIIPGKKKYRKISFDIPAGVCYYFKFSELSQIGIILTMRKTFTDYIDDVSTNYYDNKALSGQNGEIGGILADRNLKRESGYLNPSGSGRGNPKNNDNFAFAQITYSHNFIVKKRKLYTGNFHKHKEKEKCYLW